MMKDIEEYLTELTGQFVNTRRRSQIWKRIAKMERNSCVWMADWCDAEHEDVIEARQVAKRLYADNNSLIAERSKLMGEITRLRELLSPWE